MKKSMLRAHMTAAYAYADVSYCKRLQVGCIIVKNDNVIAIGYNGTHPGDENVCEDANNVTLPNVIHAEDNALRKLKDHPTRTAEGAVVFVTTAPCVACAEKLHAAGVSKVVYSTTYRSTDGIDFLRNNNIDVEQVIV